MNRGLAFLPLVALIALGLLFGLFALKHDPHIQPQALVGKPVPDLSLAGLESGQPQSLRAATANGPVLINIFASWCAPCAEEQPVLMALKAQGVAIVGVAYKDKPAASQAFLDRLGDPYRARLVDQSGRGGIELGVTGVPETYLVGSNGMILAKHTGPLNLSQARALLASAN